jgi:hypothetical protein
MNLSLCQGVHDHQHAENARRSQLMISCKVEGWNASRCVQQNVEIYIPSISDKLASKLSQFGLGKNLMAQKFFLVNKLNSTSHYLEFSGIRITCTTRLHIVAQVIFLYLASDQTDE